MAEVEQEDFREMELWEHLAELRTRLMRAALYVAVGLIAAWALYPWIYKLLFWPMEPLFKTNSTWKIIYTNVTEPFMVQLQVSLFSGLILAVPLITMELWGFVAPGLTRKERKVFYMVVPLSVIFFFMGVACGYVVMFPSVTWFTSFIPKGAELYQNPLNYMIFMVKMVVAFGICFELPMVLMFLAYIGMISSRVLVEQWRMAVVLCVAVGAVATPGGDPFSMILLAGPLAVLYLASIFLVRFVEGVRERGDKKGVADLTPA
jgi:sec-independent protein translocase protein TatC